MRTLRSPEGSPLKLPFPAPILKGARSQAAAEAGKGHSGSPGEGLYIRLEAQLVPGPGTRALTWNSPPLPHPQVAM